MQRLDVLQVGITATALSCAAPLIAVATGSEPKVIHDFKEHRDGGHSGPLVEGVDGRFYGAASDRGPHHCGTLFAVDRFSKFSVLHVFKRKNNECGPGGLFRASDGSIYGTVSTPLGGDDCRHMLKISPDGTITRFAFFLDGECAIPALTAAPNDDFYGTTTYGGAHGRGQLFRWNSRTQKVKVLFDFEGYTFSPRRVTLSADGSTLYGTTASRDNSRNGVIYRIGTNGEGFTILGLLDDLGEGGVTGPLVQAPDGSLYGALEGSGATDVGSIFRVSPDDTVSKVYTFGRSSPAGWWPLGRLTVGENGAVYGTTWYGNNNIRGTVFELSADGQMRSLLDLGGRFGCYPSGDLLRSGGFLYGVTQACDPAIFRVPEPVPQ